MLARDAPIATTARNWATLDRGRDKPPNMVLLHGASLKRAERIAACQAQNRKVAQIAFKSDWTRHKDAGFFKRNDVMLEPCRLRL